MGPDMIAAICQEQLLEFPLGHFIREYQQYQS